MNVAKSSPNCDGECFYTWLVGPSGRHKRDMPLVFDSASILHLQNSGKNESCIAKRLALPDFRYLNFLKIVHSFGDYHEKYTYII